MSITLTKPQDIPNQTGMNDNPILNRNTANEPSIIPSLFTISSDKLLQLLPSDTIEQLFTTWLGQTDDECRRRMTKEMLTRAKLQLLRMACGSLTDEHPQFYLKKLDRMSVHTNYHDCFLEPAFLTLFREWLLGPNDDFSVPQGFYSLQQHSIAAANNSKDGIVASSSAGAIISNLTVCQSRTSVRVRGTDPLVFPRCHIIETSFSNSGNRGELISNCLQKSKNHVLTGPLSSENYSDEITEALQYIVTAGRENRKKSQMEIHIVVIPDDWWMRSNEHNMFFIILQDICCY